MPKYFTYISITQKYAFFFFFVVVNLTFVDIGNFLYALHCNTSISSGDLSGNRIDQQIVSRMLSSILKAFQPTQSQPIQEVPQEPLDDKSEPSKREASPFHYAKSMRNKKPPISTKISLEKLKRTSENPGCEGSPNDSNLSTNPAENNVEPKEKYAKSSWSNEITLESIPTTKTGSTTIQTDSSKLLEVKEKAEMQSKRLSQSPSWKSWTRNCGSGKRCHSAPPSYEMSAQTEMRWLMGQNHMSDKLIDDNQYFAEIELDGENNTHLK